MLNALCSIVVVGENLDQLDDTLEHFKKLEHEVIRISDNTRAVGLLLSRFAKASLWIIAWNFPMESGKWTSTNQGWALVNDILMKLGTKTSQIICLQNNPDEFKDFWIGNKKGPNISKVSIQNPKELEQKIKELLQQKDKEEAEIQTKKEEQLQ